MVWSDEKMINWRYSHQIFAPFDLLQRLFYLHFLLFFFFANDRAGHNGSPLALLPSWWWLLFLLDTLLLQLSIHFTLVGLLPVKAVLSFLSNNVWHLLLEYFENQQLLFDLLLNFLQNNQCWHIFLLVERNSNLLSNLFGDADDLRLQHFKIIWYLILVGGFP